ncbi:MAG: hypothetical protein WDO17_15340 [Alphaproteobacteria bacterium]
MKTRTALALWAAAIAYLAASPARAQEAPPTYKADPDVYKVIFEDQNFRVIDAVRKKGQHDKPHSHPLASVVYFFTDCSDKLYAADGKTLDSSRKAGTVIAAPVTKSHSTENVGTADCHQLFVERK